MESGDILIVRDDKSFLKLFNINSNVTVTLQEPLESKNQIKEREWEKLTARVAGQVNDSSLEDNCFLNHQAGSIPISHLFQVLKPNFLKAMNTQVQSFEDPLSNEVLGVEKEVDDGLNDRSEPLQSFLSPDLGGQIDQTNERANHFNDHQETAGMSINTLAAKRIYNDTFFS